MEMKLYILTGPQDTKEHRLINKVVIVGRQDKESNWYPDIDLVQDKRVSRKHIGIWQEQGGYRIKDVGSKHGTLVNGEEIKGKANGVLLENGSEIRIGDSVLNFEPANRLHLEHNGLNIDFELLETVNFSLHHCGFSLISNLKVYNNSSSNLEPQEISFYLQGYSEEKIVRLPSLNSKQSIKIGDVDIKLDALRLEGQIEKENSKLLVKIKDEVILCKDVLILAYNAFSLEELPEHQVSLASFVQPLHPLVQRIISDTGSLVELKNSKRPERFKQIIKVIYESLAGQYSLHYDMEMSYSPEKSFQRIRLPHQVLENVYSKEGRGTCIDLSILMAACLENAGLKPLVFLVRYMEDNHAFAGCWQEDTDKIEPLILDKEDMVNMIKSGMILPIECTGFTHSKQQLTFEAAITAASESLKKHKLLFALDVYAARRYGGRDGITPLPFAGAPRYSEEIERVLNKAREFALTSRSKVLGTPHLLLGLLELKNGIMQKIFSEHRINPLPARKKIMQGLQDNAPVDSKPKPTYHYEEVIKIAGIVAGRKNSAFVEEPHLIEALLEVRSDALEGALRAVSMTPQQCLQMLYQATGIKSSFTSSRSYFCDN